MADLAIVVTDGILITDTGNGLEAAITVDWATSNGRSSDATIRVPMVDLFSQTSVLINRAIRDRTREYITANYPDTTFVIQDQTVVFGAPSVL